MGLHIRLRWAQARAVVWTPVHQFAAERLDRALDDLIAIRQLMGAR